ncbi:hypothetical protein NFI96_009336 [Prochilodus magdalenae]|nr:hypothetical protein NFI96_009336 [Prochilodus magdalenae]
MARPVLSGTCPIKTLYGLGHHAAAQFQGLGSTYSPEHLYVLFSDPQRVPVTSMRECESDNTKFNTPAPHSHLRPCDTNESNETKEGNWIIWLYDHRERLFFSGFSSEFKPFTPKRTGPDL